MFSRDSYTQGVVGAGLGAAARHPLPSVVAPTPSPQGEGTAPITSVLKETRVFPPPPGFAAKARVKGMAELGPGSIRRTPGLHSGRQAWSATR
jgi:hypothetical protein